MNRRHLLELAATAPLLARPARATTPPRASAPRLRVHDDGSFDIEGEGLALRRCYPALDDEPLRPTKLEIERGDRSTIRYKVDRGTVTLRLAPVDDAVVVQATLEGFAEAPHWVYPIASATIEGADRFYKQGLGFGGPSGLFDLPKAGFWHDPNNLLEAAYSYDSFMTAAVVAPSLATLAIGALEHRDYLQRTTFYNRTHRRELAEKEPASDRPLVEAGFSTERIPTGGRPLELPALHVVGGARTYETLRRLATKMATASNVKLRHRTRFHWDSWYEFMEGHDRARLDDTLAGFRAVKPPLPFQGVLIDAGFSRLGDWDRADERLYPGGLKATMEAITAAGHVPGLWVGPFMVSSNSALYQKHPDWVLRGTDGKPLVRSKGKPYFFIFDSQEERYFLDTSHPEAFAHLRQLFRTYRAWGIRSYKLDFMEWGFRDSTLARRHTPGKTSVQYYADVLKMIREEAGEDAFLVGCISPMSPMVGIADSFRVGYDVDTNTWKPGGNTVNMFHETAATQYMNNVLWQNDPDVVYVRDGSGSNPMTDDEVESLALWSGILGGSVTTSDRPHRLTPARLALLRFVQPGKTRATAEFPLWHARGRKALVPVRAYPEHGAFGVLVTNPGEGEVSESFSLKELVGTASATCFRWRVGRAEKLGVASKLDVKLGRHQSALYWVSTRGTPPPADLGIAGERVPGLPTT